LKHYKRKEKKRWRIIFVEGGSAGRAQEKKKLRQKKGNAAQELSEI